MRRMTRNRQRHWPSGYSSIWVWTSDAARDAGPHCAVLNCRHSRIWLSVRLRLPRPTHGTHRDCRSRFDDFERTIRFENTPSSGHTARSRSIRAHSSSPRNEGSHKRTQATRFLPTPQHRGVLIRLQNSAQPSSALPTPLSQLIQSPRRNVCHGHYKAAAQFNQVLSTIATRRAIKPYSLGPSRQHDRSTPFR